MNCANCLTRAQRSQCSSWHRELLRSSADSGAPLREAVFRSFIPEPIVSPLRRLDLLPSRSPAKKPRSPHPASSLTRSDGCRAANRACTVSDLAHSDKDDATARAPRARSMQTAHPCRRENPVHRWLAASHAPANRFVPDHARPRQGRFLSANRRLREAPLKIPLLICRRARLSWHLLLIPAMTASPNAEVETSVAPGICRARS